MDIAFGKDKWSQADAGAVGESVQPEWHGLRARMAAVLQARRAIEQEVMGDLALACGSFDRTTAKLIGSFEGEELAPVNRNRSTDFKAARDTYVVVAETSSGGDRG